MWLPILQLYWRFHAARHRPLHAATCVSVWLLHLVLQANPLVRAALEEQGAGRVLVVDGGASMRWVLRGRVRKGCGCNLIAAGCRGLAESGGISAAND